MDQFSQISPFYVAPVLALVTALVTLAHLFVSSGPTLSDKAFMRIRVAWYVLVFIGGAFACGGLYQAPMLAKYSGDDRRAFLLGCIWLGLIGAAYAGFGLFAWAFPRRWQFFRQRCEESSAARRRRAVSGE
jgi:hypothetical protein